MIRSFGVRDLLLVGNLQKKGACLDPEIALTRPYSPLLAALSSYFPIHEAGTSTFILEAMDQSSPSTGRRGERSPEQSRRAVEPSGHRVGGAHRPPVFGFIVGLGGRDVTPEPIKEIVNITLANDAPPEEISWIGVKK